MSGDFKFVKRVGNERIERDSAGNTLKKYGGTPTSWPVSKVQMFEQSHRDQQDALKRARENITEFFKRV